MKFTIFILGVIVILLAILAVHAWGNAEEIADMSEYIEELDFTSEQAEPHPPTDMSFALTYLLIGDAEPDISEKEYWYRRALDVAYCAGERGERA